jgi:hypothetical protein
VTVENDITQRIAPQASTFENDVNGFPASGLAGALALHKDAQSLSATVTSATSNVKSAGSFT